MSTAASRHSSPAYWRVLKTVSCSRASENSPLPAMISPSRVRSVRSVSSSPMMRLKPVSGCAGLVSQ
jgi:hypothetical protein